jgi:hypothetical protein
VDPKSFPLPNLGSKLFTLRHDIHNGKGFGVVRGVDPASFSVEDLNLVWLGIQSYIAEQRGRQDRRGNMLGQQSCQCTSWQRWLTARLVHIVADNSTKQAAEHHRHSTKPIVSLLGPMSDSSGLKLTETIRPSTMKNQEMLLVG